MKYLYFPFIFVSFIFMSNKNIAQSTQVDPSDEKRFAVRGKILELNNVKVRLVNDGRELQNLKFNKNNTFVFRMSWNFDYIIEFSKTGYVTQIISVSSIIPASFNKVDAGIFEIENVQLFKETEGLEIDFYNQPIAHIEFDNDQNKFVFAYDYRNDLSKAIKDFQEKEKIYKETLRKGLSYLKNEEYKKALQEYLKASNIKPDEDFPKTKIDEINILIKEEKSKTTSPDETTENIPDNESPEIEAGEVIAETQEDAEKSRTIDEDLDQLVELLNQNMPDESSNLMESIGDKYFDQNDLSKALNFYNQSLQLKKELNDTKGTSNVLNRIALVEFDSGRYEASIKDYNESLMILRNLKDKPAMTAVLNNLGGIYESTYRYANAINSYKEAIELSEKLGDTEQMSEIMSSLGGVHFKQGNYQEAINTYRKTIEIDSELGKEAVISNTLNNIGISYYNWGKLDEAIDSYEKSMKIADKLGNEQEVSVTLNNIGNINYDWKKYSSALGYYERSLKIKEELNYQKGIALSLHNIGNVHKGLEEYETALDYYERSSKIGKEIKYKELVSKNYKSFSNVYALQEQYDKALEFYKLYTDSKFSLTEAEKRDQLNEMLERFEVEKSKTKKEITKLKSELFRQKLLAKIESDRNAKEIRIKDLEIQQKEEEVKNQRTLTALFSAGFIILLVFVIILFRLIRQKTAANKQLAEQRDQISEQKKEITDSIKYAERIQSALLPDSDVLEDITDHFIFFRPKDIVSGDFYWTAKKDNKIIVAAVDCTGHGVPGAFMSMLGISYLNEIISSKKTLSSDEILNQLRDQVIKSLHQTDEKEGARDGMDMALCIIDYDKMEIEYSGAYNPLYLVRNKELIVHKADKMPIGIHALVKPKPFTLKRIPIEKNDSLFVFSDGYMDQFGGRDGRKFMSTRFKELLVENSNMTMKEQKQIIESTFENWKLESDQIDDVLIIGIKI